MVEGNDRRHASRLLAAALVGFALLLGVGPSEAQGLEICAKIDLETGLPRENSSLKLRSACKTRKDGTPTEVSIGRTESLGGDADAVASNTARIDQLGEAVAALSLASCARVGGACWFFGATGESCDAVCGNRSLSYDDATDTYAGSGGTNAQCEQVLQALRDTNVAVPDDVDGIDAAVVGGSGRGCHTGSLCPEGADGLPSCWLRDPSPTSPSASNGVSRRACACR